MKRLFTHMGMTMFTLGLALFPLEKNEFFGSEGDWISQHVGAAENIRQMVLSTGSIFPQYSTAGGGCNIYDYAYYGLYRPEVLLSCMFPRIEMKYFIAGYALLCMMLSVNLCYLWLSRKKLSPRYAVFASLLLSCASCFFHAHHQIIFVNYLPYLLMALMGIDRLIERNRSGLMIFGLAMICFHSFYYAPCCFVVCLLYGLDQMKQTADLSKQSVFFSALRNAFLAIGIGGVLLLPTGLNILSTTKDAGAFMDEGLPLLDLTMKGMLFTPYGCGLTLIALFSLLISLKQKPHRALALSILLVMTVPAAAWVLNGGLYARGKVLIPFLPLIVWLCGEAVSSAEQWLRDRDVSKGWFKWVVPLFLIVPVLTSLIVNQSEAYIPADDQRQSRFSFEELSDFAADKTYRFDWLGNSFVNSNLLFDGETYKTAMYSSINNGLYGQFYYDIMNNPISLRNRVVLMPNQNPFFNYFMGIRYVQCHVDQIPAGYQKVKQSGDYVLAENRSVLPIAYGTNQLLSLETYRDLTFPQTMESLCKYAVVDGNVGQRTFDSKIEEVEFGQYIEGEIKPGSSTLTLKENLAGKVLILEFDVADPKAKGVEITIDGIKNHLSAGDAPYPNHNDRFTYIFAVDEDVSALPVSASKGEWTVDHLRAYVMDMEDLGNQRVYPAKETNGKDRDTMFAGEVNMEEDGFFITSFPYREGYRIFVDGEIRQYEQVNTAFVGFPLEAGQHQLQIDYQAPGFVMGLMMSFGAIMLSGVVVVWERKRENERNN